VPVCPKCKIKVDIGALYCPVDGTALSPLDPTVDALPAAASPAAAPPSEGRPTIPLTTSEGRPTKPLTPAAPGPPRRAAPSAPPSSPPPAPLSDTNEELIGQIIDGRYRVISRLGEGGIGHVFYGEHTQTRRTVAIKLLHRALADQDAYRLRFEREAQAASALTHPSCVSILDFGSHAGLSYLVMEFVEGQLLTDYLEQGSAPLGEVVEITLQILAALKHAHDLGIVHRDIKPANIMLCEPDLAGTRVKILDFGLAKSLIFGEPGSQQLTQHGMVCGTPAYLAPEQASAKEVDTRADLYSLGVVLFLMICGRKPFDSDDPMELIVAHQQKQPPSARELRPEVSPALQAVIERAMAKSPDDRFQDAEAFAAALEPVPDRRASAAALGSPREVAGSGAVARLWASARERLALTLGIAGAGLVLLIVVIAVAASGGPADSTDAAALDPAADPDHKTQPGGQPPAITKPKVPPPPLPRVPKVDDSKLRALLTRATAALKRGRLDQAEELARQAVLQDRSSGAPHLVMGHVYYRKLWFTDAIKEYGKAVSRDPELRKDEGLLKRAVGCLVRHKSTGKTIYFLTHAVGEPARPHLQRLASSHSDPAVRGRARHTLRRLKR
jgi:tRNA A-37 threonylcarbamoyl transferase component Bud32/tetratricopeptide (TPR) repeat protein